LASSSRPALASTQPPIQWVPAAFSTGVKQPVCEAYYSLSSSDEAKKAWSYTYTPHTSSWRGTCLSAETTLPYLTFVFHEK
jgi:hypothetical protein